MYMVSIVFGVLLAIIGSLLCLTVVGAIIGLPLLGVANRFIYRKF